MFSGQIARLIDVNVNRACEGLRVIEDYYRLIRNDEERSEQLKEIRHFFRGLFSTESLIPYRDSINDVGQGKLKYGSESRSDVRHIITAGFKRVEESIRVIEEYAKLEDAQKSGEEIRRIEAFRYRIYQLEKEYYLSGEEPC